MRLREKHIVLGISGGIAAYKAASLLRLLIKEGAEVQVVMTPSGREFITPVTLSALSGKPVITEFFTANSGEWHSHVDLGLWADLMIVAPATASTIAKMATGVADNMLVTTYLSAKEPVMVAPAMDLDMYRHPTTRRNLSRLAEDGVIVLDSPEGFLASGLSGKGRMMEPEEILEAVVRFFNKKPQDLSGKKAVITAGPTRERLDPVRYIGNFSSGKMGVALAEELAARGAEVTVVAGPVCDAVARRLAADSRIKVENVETALEMLESVKRCYAEADIAIFAAAVADYRAENCSNEKIKREKEETLTLKLVANPDIAAELGKIKEAGQFNVGFALETNDGRKNALGKLQRKNLDLIVLNPATEPDAGCNTDTNRITLIDGCGEEKEFPVMTKQDCAAAIIDEILRRMKK